MVTCIRPLVKVALDVKPSVVEHPNRRNKGDPRVRFQRPCQMISLNARFVLENAFKSTTSF